MPLGLYYVRHPVSLKMADENKPNGTPYTGFRRLTPLSRRFGDYHRAQTSKNGAMEWYKPFLQVLTLE